jgi:hypothetical protein
MSFGTLSVSYLLYQSSSENILKQTYQRRIKKERKKQFGVQNKAKLLAGRLCL